MINATYYNKKKLWIWMMVWSLFFCWMKFNVIVVIKYQVHVCLQYIYRLKKWTWITSELENNQPEPLKTPIEIALGIDSDGMTTARKLYEFLGMDASNYSRWVKTNITENPFAEENTDYFYSSSMTSEQKRGNFSQDFKLTANFAKKLSMQGKTERAEQAREYFIRVEDKLKEVAFVCSICGKLYLSVKNKNPLLLSIFCWGR